MIYLNYAATSWPKPQCVLDACRESLEGLPSAQYRSADIHDNSDLFAQTKAELADLFGVGEKDRIFFSSGSTDGLNRIITGLGLKASAFLTTVTEHNSVLRPLFNLTNGEKPVIVSCNEEGRVAPEDIESAISPATRALILNHCSNVTGVIQDAAAIGKIAKKHGLIYILDLSQSAGCIPIHADDWGVDAFAFTGHKSLFGLQGTGGYYVKSTIALKPLLYGGTGKDSSRILYADPGDYEYEVGTQNSSGIAALFAAVRYVKELGPSRIHEAENRRMAYLLAGLSEIPGIRLIGKDLADRGPLLSLTIPGMDPGDIAYILQTGYGIISRAGLQCAPLIHPAIGCENKGTLRLSISHTTTGEELDAVITALGDIAGSVTEQH